jgi:hypothetical protein
VPVPVVHLPGMNTTDPTPRTSRQAGTLTLTVWPESPVSEHQRYAYRIEDATTGHSLEGRDLFTGAGAPVAPERALRDPAGESRQYIIDNPGNAAEHASMFPAWAAEAARQNADALTLLSETPPPSTSEPSWFDRPAISSDARSRGRSL